MLRLVGPLFLLVALLLPTPVAVAKKAKPLKLQPLVDELAARGVAVDDVMKTVKVAERCLQGDSHWKRDMDNRAPLNQLYEGLVSSVTCWQMAANKFTKAGEPVAPILPWVTARLRYVEGLRGYLWAMEAKMKGERTQVCKRLSEAIKQAAEANKVADGLADGFQVEEAKALAQAADQQAAELGEMVAQEVTSQRCN